MIDLHTWPTPNGRKPAIALEELGLAYTVHPVDITQKVQFTPEYLRLNPNNKIPALVDRRGGAPVVVFESGAILIHLAETTAGGNRLLPSSTSSAERADVLQWLMWQVAGLGPMMGKAGAYANEAASSDGRDFAGAVADDFLAEVDRLWSVLDAQLQRTGQFVAGAGFSIADIACYPWMAVGWGQSPSPRYAAALQRRPELKRFTNIPRWVDLVGQRAAVQKGMAILAPKT